MEHPSLININLLLPSFMIIAIKSTKCKLQHYSPLRISSFKVYRKKREAKEGNKLSNKKMRENL